MTILLFDPSGQPLDPHTAETYDGEFWAVRPGSYHAARIMPALAPAGGPWDESCEGVPVTWTAYSPRDVYGVMQRAADDPFVFVPLSRPGQPPRSSQQTLADALESILPA
jgi:hypothetical protein